MVIVRKLFFKTCTDQLRAMTGHTKNRCPPLLGLKFLWPYIPWPASIFLESDPMGGRSLHSTLTAIIPCTLLSTLRYCLETLPLKGQSSCMSNPVVFCGLCSLHQLPVDSLLEITFKCAHISQISLQAAGTRSQLVPFKHKPFMSLGCPRLRCQQLWSLVRLLLLAHSFSSLLCFIQPFLVLTHKVARPGSSSSKVTDPISFLMTSPKPSHPYPNTITFEIQGFHNELVLVG